MFQNLFSKKWFKGDTEERDAEISKDFQYQIPDGEGFTSRPRSYTKRSIPIIIKDSKGDVSRGEIKVTSKNRMNPVEFLNIPDQDFVDDYNEKLFDIQIDVNEVKRRRDVFLSFLADDFRDKYLVIHDITDFENRLL